MARKETIADEIVISSLLSCPTLEDAAQRCGLSIRQLYERRQNPDFMRKLTEAQAEALATTTRFLQKATGSAAALLLEIVESTNRPPQIRLTAAKTILEQAAKYTEAVDVQNRLEALERYFTGGDEDAQD